MPHYAMLRDHHFEDETGDIRGANLRAHSGKQIGTVEDAIIDHESGHIRYLIVNAGSERDELPKSSGSQPEIDAAATTPRRLVDKFAGAGEPITASGAPNLGARATLRPVIDTGDALVKRGRRWERFEQNLRKDLPNLRSRCDVCGGKQAA